MTDDSTDISAITTAEEFDETLGRLLRTAFEHDIDPKGAWEYHHDGTGPDVEVLIHELVSDDSAGQD